MEDVGCREGSVLGRPHGVLLRLQWELVLVSILNPLFRNMLLLGFLQQKKMVTFFSSLNFRVIIQTFQIITNCLPGAQISKLILD